MFYSPLPVWSKHVRQLNGLWIWHIIADQGGTFDVVKSSDSAFLFEIEAHEDSEKVLRVLSIQQESHWDKPLLRNKLPSAFPPDKPARF
ncbi:hypothetical protein AX768_31090 (plasmid) [Burkholderia sp. PAMC 28687]|nr:hypothetical protein AX768_31090 [Burkholderia sp. PAMC 28687]